MLRTFSDYFNEGYIPKELVEEKPRIALYGCFQVGKSTLINCLMNHYVALTGKGLATTSLVSASMCRHRICSPSSRRTLPA